jgi:MerR family copper efflux transcriptional regulator
MRSLRIGQVARESGVGLETVRFYERQGLVPRPPRRASGYRAYPPDSVARIRFIRTAKELGFSLKEIRELLSLRIRPVRSCAKVRTISVAKLEDIEGRIAMLHRMRQALRELVAACDAHRPTTACPVLDALDRSASR